MLPIDLPKSDVDSLMAAAREKRSFSVDLAAQTITVSGDGAPAQISFEVDAFRKHCLLNGFDDIGLTLQKVESISKFETGRSLKTPWLDGTDYKPK
jgi:3-isopropylmalate dehydratase small subunit